MSEYFDDYDISCDLKLDKSETKAHRRREERRRRKELKFSNKKHPKTAVIADVFAACVLVFLVVSIIIATAASGNAGMIVGIFAFAGFVFAAAGFILGIISLLKTDVLYGLAWFGIISNGILWLLVCLIFVMGF